MKKLQFVIRNKKELAPLYDPELGHLLVYSDQHTAEDRLKELKKQLPKWFDNAEIAELEVSIKK